MSKKLACFILAIFFLSAGCGKEGPPTPPVPDIPRPVDDLVVSQHAGRVMLSWSYPSLTTSGKSLSSIEKIVVYRFDEEMPESLADKEVETASAPPDIALFSQIAPPTPAQFKRASVPVAELASDQLPEYSSGTLIIFEDQPSIRSAAGRAMRYTYGVITEGRRVQSDISNLGSIVPQQPVSAPERLIARLSPERVQLVWEPSTSFVDGEGNPHVSGYRIYRSFFGESGTLLNETPVAQPVYEDRPAYGTYTYYVTAVTATEPDIESAPSDTVSVEFRDMLPPPAPGNLTVLVEDAAVRLIWDPVSAIDLNGYIVYRWDGVAKIRLNDVLITQTSYRDDDPAPGVEYIYGVTSVDKSGNESAQTASDSVTFIR